MLRFKSTGNQKMGVNQKEVPCSPQLGRESNHKERQKQQRGQKGRERNPWVTHHTQWKQRMTFFKTQINSSSSLKTSRDAAQVEIPGRIFTRCCHFLTSVTLGKKILTHTHAHTLSLDSVRHSINATSIIYYFKSICSWICIIICLLYK